MSRSDTNNTVLSKMEIVVDKMHMAGHVDKWCKETCDPRIIEDLAKVCPIPVVYGTLDRICCLPPSYSLGTQFCC